MSIGFDEKDGLLLEKLNRRSWTDTFLPDDIDWAAVTTAQEFRSLYDAWSLLLGTRHEKDLSDEQRILFAQYQQMNLMMGTALFERYAIANFESLYGDDNDPAYQEYVSHLIKEETYHYVLFSRAIACIRESDAALHDLPARPMKVYISVVLFLLRIMPSRKLRHSMFFYLLHFVEQTTLHANTMAKRALGRDESLVRKVWEAHAIDEARHVAFDDLMMRKAALPGAWRRVPMWLTIPVCVGASLLINLNEIWAARRIGIRVGYHELPFLLKRTTAPFKRKVIGSLTGGGRNTEKGAT